MIRVLHSLIDSVFPPRETEIILRTTTHLPEKLGTYEGIQYLSDYQNPAVKAAVTENKFHHNQKAARLLAHLCDHWNKKQTQDIIWIPIPLGPRRQKERGYNQVESILLHQKHVRSTSFLTRTETQPQVGLERTVRLRNVSQAFTWNGKALAENTLYVLLDDVVTTGATLKAARASLAPHLPSSSRIICLAIAH